MPLFQLSTNISKSDFPEHFHEDLTQMLGQLLKKNPEHITICVSADQFLTCGGTAEACAFGNLASVGSFYGKNNDGYVRAVFEFIKEKLGIESKRFTLFLSDYPPNDVGFNGMTIDSFRRSLPAPGG
ncbi:macrophage migration inhibitory factor-like [Paramacrobiotus metropolitanus]|uniref:macrophage migration inhibitory factor-like n=1 Tax=Paramacrobiotus metropolitanus TaxID=2943436 RepID=UPI0024460C48|nr:macrophage migration inhibitory factor-like [Paramacrobiotus metropolitanus]